MNNSILPFGTTRCHGRIKMYDIIAKLDNLYPNKGLHTAYNNLNAIDGLDPNRPKVLSSLSDIFYYLVQMGIFDFEYLKEYMEVSTPTITKNGTIGHNEEAIFNFLEPIITDPTDGLNAYFQKEKDANPLTDEEKEYLFMDDDASLLTVYSDIPLVIESVPDKMWVMDFMMLVMTEFICQNRSNIFWLNETGQTYRSQCVSFEADDALLHYADYVIGAGLKDIMKDRNASVFRTMNSIFEFTMDYTI